MTLRFAWPGDLRAAVIGHDLTESANSDGSDPMQGDSWADLRLEVQPAVGGVRLHFVTDGRSRVRSQGFAPDIGGARPELHLDATGRVERVDHIEAMRETVRRAAQEGTITPDQAQGLLRNTTDAGQLGTAAAHWDWALHAWNGRTLTCGQPARLTARVPALSFGSATVETDTELEYAGRVDCTRGGVARSCALLEVRQRDVGSSAARAIAASGMSAGRATVAGAWFVRTVRVVAEPETLVLHRVEFEERWEIEWDHEGRRTTRYIRDVQSYAFDYDRPPQPTGLQWVVTREGAPGRPDTPSCRWVDACCEAMRTSMVAQFICATIPHDGATECTADDMSAARGAAITLDGGPPPECTAPTP